MSAHNDKCAYTNNLATQQQNNLPQEMNLYNYSDVECLESEPCSICFDDFAAQEIGYPEMCNHRFCFRCLLKWSTKHSTCPIDRKPFNKITVRNADGTFINVIAVESLDKKEHKQCQICEGRHQQIHMLFCSSCCSGYHLLCLFPALDEVPNQNWKCPRCEAKPTLRRSARLLAKHQNYLTPYLAPVTSRVSSSPRVRNRRSRANR